jgi:hypothetical protein
VRFPKASGLCATKDQTRSSKVIVSHRQLGSMLPKTAIASDRNPKMPSLCSNKNRSNVPQADTSAVKTEDTHLLAKSRQEIAASALERLKSDQDLWPAQTTEAVSMQASLPSQHIQDTQHDPQNRNINNTDIQPYASSKNLSDKSHPSDQANEPRSRTSSLTFDLASIINPDTPRAVEMSSMSVLEPASRTLTSTSTSNLKANTVNYEFQSEQLFEALGNTSGLHLSDTSNDPFVIDSPPVSHLENSDTGDYAVATYGERKFLCTYAGCGKRFLRKTDVTRHMRIHLNERPFKCAWPGCGKGIIV